MSMKQAHLVDVSSLFFRYYFAPGRSLVNEEGWEVGALAHTVNWLVKDEFLSADVVVVAFDESLGTGFRHELDDDYKANRPLPTEDIVYQLTLLKHFCEALGYCVLASEEFEADDLLASAIASLNGFECTVHSRDKDLRQLISATASVVDPVSGQVWTERALWEEMKLTPDQIPLYLALMGDSSDNITGLPGIGDKTAKALLLDCPNLPDLMSTVESGGALNVRGAKRVAETIIEYEDLIHHNLKLTELTKHAPVVVPALDRDLDLPDVFDALCERFGIASWCARSVDKFREHRE